MTLNELIDELQELKDEHGDTEVVMTADYGDICHTIQALPIRAVGTRHTEESAYSNSRVAIKEANEWGDEDKDGNPQTGPLVVALI